MEVEFRRQRQVHHERSANCTKTSGLIIQQIRIDVREFCRNKTTFVQPIESHITCYVDADFNCGIVLA